MSGPGLRVGNDVVDLTAPRIRGKSADERFVRRVLAPTERELVAAAEDGDEELFSLWAAKEAAYKVVSKLEGRPPPFIHASFVVAWSPAGPGAAAETLVHGIVTYAAHGLPVAVERSGDVIHALAHGSPDRAGAGTAGPAAPPRDPATRTVRALHRLDEPDAEWAAPEPELLARLSERERGPVHSRASAAVRVGAKATLVRELGLGPEGLEIMCGEGPKGRQPPYVLVDGEPADVDLSLSHHGAWIGWAICGPALRPGRG